MNIPNKKEEISKNRIGRLIYRNDESMMKHERVVIQFENFLGDIAGVYDLLMLFFMFIFGDYIDFIGKVKWVKRRYRFLDLSLDHHETTEQINDDGLLNFTMADVTWFYMK